MKSTKKAKAPRTVKHVRFAENSVLVVTRPKSSRDLKSLWFTKQEMREFGANAARSTQEVLDKCAIAADAYIKKTLLGPNDCNSDQFVGVEEICGIEHGLSKLVCRALLTAQSKVINDVLEEQRRQKATCVCDSDKLAEISKKSSLFPILWRQRIAVVNSEA